MPAVAMVSCVGIYGLSGSTFDLLMMIAFGVGGYILRKMDVPLVPVMLGVLLGSRMEDNLRQALTISDGQWSVLWKSPFAWCSGGWRSSDLSRRSWSDNSCGRNCRRRWRPKGSIPTEPVSYQRVRSARS